MGYKLGGGNYQSFSFSPPSIQGEYDQRDEREHPGRPRRRARDPYEDELEDKHKGKFGTIIVEFFKTEQFERPYRATQGVQKKDYDNGFVEDNNKKILSDMRIKPGRKFTFEGRGPPPSRDRSRDNDFSFGRKRDHKFDEKRGDFRGDRGGRGGFRGGSFRGGHGGSLHSNRDRHDDDRDGLFERRRDDRSGRHTACNTPEDGEMIMDTKVLYDQMIDSIEIKYANWAHLQFHNLVDIKKYDHLKLVPPQLLSSAEFIHKALWTITRHKDGIRPEYADEDFNKATGHKISDYFEFAKGELE